MTDSRKILLGCSGSVASIKLEPLIEKLLCEIKHAQVRVILTNHALHFTAKKEDTDRVKYYTDNDEWQTWTNMGDDVLHIELGKWADAFLIAPLSANSLAKISNGLCDNLLTCTVRAWDMNKPLLFAAAMNTRMLNHPITRPQIDSLVALGYIKIPTMEKLLACGEKGDGAMASIDTIITHLCEALHAVAAL